MLTVSGTAFLTIKGGIMGKDKDIGIIDWITSWVEEKMENEIHSGYTTGFSSVRMEAWEELLEMLERAKDDEK